MKPLANFRCKPCAKLTGVESVTHEDLPVDSVRCPYCGKKRGFERLFDGFSLGSGKIRTLDREIKTRVEPVFTAHQRTVDSASRFERDSQVAMEKAFQLADPATRAKMSTVKGITAAGALSMIPQHAKAHSSAVLYPALTNRRVVPTP